MLLYLPAQVPTVVRDADRIVATVGGTRLEIGLKDGRYSLAWAGLAHLDRATSNVRLADGRERCAADYTTHQPEIAKVTDAVGSGVRIDVRHQKDGEPDLVTSFWLYAGRPEAVVQVAVVSPTPVSTDRMLPAIGDGGGGLDRGENPEVLFVPFDNDAWVRFHSKNWSESGESYEVGGTYDNLSRHGLIVGSLDHDVWKSAVQFRGRHGHDFAKLYAYAGATGEWTHDREPHGFVTGTTVRSPRFSLGAYTDWRDGLEAFGRANALLRPALAWNGPPPTGWNSWSALMAGLNESKANAAADLVQNLGFRYVNLDACWTNIPDPRLPEFVKRVHAMGLKAGIYASPFSAWQNSLDGGVEGTDGRYRLRDIVLKDHDGKPFPRIDGGWPVDPTHPGTRMRNDWTFARFKAWGFDYVKLDFMHMGALEARHYDPTVTTGIQAYNFGMKEVDRDLSGLFLSLSIAPIFPHGYAHSRRISCDAFADIDQSEYMLNSLTYGWWQHGTLYPFNDPDHTVVYHPAQHDAVDETTGRTRLNASLAVGGMLLTGDDATDPAARARVLRLFTNPEVLALAKRGRTFRPIEGDTGSSSATDFTMRDGSNAYIALFNFSRTATRNVRLDLARAGLGGASWRVTDLWTGTQSDAEGRLGAAIPPKGSLLLRLNRR